MFAFLSMIVMSLHYHTEPDWDIFYGKWTEA
jgi:hypothetical protein